MALQPYCPVIAPSDLDMLRCLGQQAPTPQVNPIVYQQGYIGPDEWLKVRVWTYVGSQTVSVRGRMMRPSGRVETFSREFQTNAWPNDVSQMFQVGEGVLQYMAVASSRTDICEGNAYAVVTAHRTAGGTDAAWNTLLAGYLTSIVPLSYPNSPLQKWNEGAGTLSTYSGSNPAPGVEPSISSGSQVSWKLHQFQVSLATDATVGNRQLIFHIYDLNGDARAEVVSPYLHPASTSRNYIFQAGAPESVQGVDTIFIPVSCCIEPIFDVTYNVCVHGTWGVGDNFGSPIATVQEWMNLCV